MKALLTAVLAVTLATTFRPPALAAGTGSLPNFTVENVHDFAPDFFSMEEYRGRVVVLAFFGYW
jgi:hypothetical protein